MEPVTSRAFPGANKFKLGLFSFNTGGGLTQTLAPERWDPSWTHMVQLAREAEAAGLEFLLPLAGWIDHQGAADNDGHFHETITWAGGLLAATERIHVFATIHVPFLHPVFAAKQAVTCDHIGGGRFGLNLVAGYNIQEFDMFGIDYGEHEARYAYLDEWLHVVKRLWQEPERFDHEGRFFQVKAAFSQPKPVDCGLPMVVSAGSSQAFRSTLKNNVGLFALVWALGAHLKAFLGFWPHLIQ
ncbi:MAG: LLM class flavin-dependent oxidoreductase, partial [Pseudomonadota bacterium]